MSSPRRELRRILMTADTVGGVWTYAEELAAALQPARLEIVLATMGGPAQTWQRAAVQRLSHVQLHEGDFRLEWMQDASADVAAAGEWLLELARDCRVDLVHLNGYGHADLPWPVPVLVVGHSCVYSWFESVRGELPPAEWEHYHELVRRGLQASDAVTAPTTAMLAALARHYGAFRAYGPIANGRRLPLRAGRKEPVVLTVGRFWDEAKNLSAVDAAAGALDCPVYAAGATRLGNTAAATPKHLVALGPLAPDALAEWYARASVFALPARYEPFGLAALEAGSAGCALVLGDIPSLREVWGDAAQFVEPDDAAALAATLRRLVAEPDTCARWGARARAHARQLTPERMAQAYLELYGRLVGRAGALLREGSRGALTAPVK